MAPHITVVRKTVNFRFQNTRTRAESGRAPAWKIAGVMNYTYRSTCCDFRRRKIRCGTRVDGDEEKISFRNSLPITTRRVCRACLWRPLTFFEVVVWRRNKLRPWRLQCVALKKKKSDFGAIIASSSFLKKYTPSSAGNEISNHSYRTLHITRIYTYVA